MAKLKAICNLSERCEDVIREKWTVHNWLKQTPSVYYLLLAYGTKYLIIITYLLSTHWFLKSSFYGISFSFLLADAFV